VSFIGLVGLQREITLFIFETLKITLDKVTPPIAISHLAESCKTTVLSAQKTIQRLDAAGLIKRVSFKNGRSGWTRYSLDERIYGEMLQSESSDKLKTNLGQSSDKLKTQPRTQLRTSPPIVVVSSNFKNTTNTETANPDEPCFVIPNELAGKVSRRQLSEFVASGKISEYDLQLSLDAFAFDLRNKLVSIKHSSNPVGLLIGAIKNNGSYNSAKYIEALKSELKPLIDTQREFTAEKASIKTSPEWAQFLEFKQNNPEQYKNLEEKMANIGLKGALLEDFTFLEYKKEVLKVGDETELNPLRPLESQSP
jgi:predicted transcriptional regulator